MKPSYGRLSRYGQILYSSSNDVIGPMARSVEDLRSLFGKSNGCQLIEIMEGEDIHDSNCIDFSSITKVRGPQRLKRGAKRPLKGLRVGVVDEFDIDELDTRNRAMQSSLLALLKD